MYIIIKSKIKINKLLITMKVLLYLLKLFIKDFLSPFLKYHLKQIYDFMYFH
jgi:hypothetical protein